MKNKNISAIVVKNELFVVALEGYWINEEAFDFGFIGTSILHVKNKDDHPSQWEYKEFHLPNSDNDLTFGSSVYQDENWVYLVGQHKKHLDTRIVLAKIKYSHFFLIFSQ